MKYFSQYVLRQHLCSVFSEENASIGQQDVKNSWTELALTLFAMANNLQPPAGYCLMLHIGRTPPSPTVIPEFKGIILSC